MSSFDGLGFSESLESRFLLSTTILLQGSELIITGTNGADNIRVSISASKLTAQANGMTRSFDAKSVKSININAKSGDDVVQNATAIPSTLSGGHGNDTLIGGPGNDNLNGGGDNDLIRPGDGNNSGTLDLASDSLDYRDATPGEFSLDGVDEEFPVSPTQLQIGHGPGFSNDFSDQFALTSVQHHHLNFAATPGNDNIGGALDMDAIIHGGSGNDAVGVSTGYNDSDASISLYGDAGNDTLSANGEDTFVAFGDGGPGNDSYSVVNSHDYSGPFIDTGGGNDSIEIDLTGDPSGDGLLFIPTGIEDAYVEAGPFGNDLAVTGNNLNNKITLDSESGQRATILGGDGNDSLIGGDGNEDLQGGNGNDTLIGNAGDDTLWGNDGKNKMDGGDGNDEFHAHNGRTDTLDGGDGSDIASRDNGPTIFDQVMNIEKFV